MTNYANYGWGLLLLILIASCQQKSEYHRLVEQELAIGERQDSLFLGIYLGMRSQEFFDHCWKLNKKRLIDQDGGKLPIQYELKDALKASGKMNFYPTFHEGIIYEMPTTFTYHGWSPWNKSLQADSLQVDVLRLMKEWYGEGFIDVKHPTGAVAHVKVDRNRRITIYTEPLQDQEVKVVFTDLIKEKELKKIA